VAPPATAPQVRTHAVAAGRMFSRCRVCCPNPSSLPSCAQGSAASWLQTAPSAAQRWTAAGSSGGRLATRRPRPSAPARRWAQSRLQPVVTSAALLEARQYHLPCKRWQHPCDVLSAAEPPAQVRVDRLQRVRRMQMAHYLDALRRAVAPPPESVAPPFTGTPGPPTGAVTPRCLPSPQVCVQHRACQHTCAGAPRSA
jgi:hypothetical protein